MKNRVTPMLAIALLSAALLSACSVSVSPTISGDALAKTAHEALKAQFAGKDFTVVCDDDQIKLIAGKKYDCVVTDENGLDYDTKVTISSVSGAKYTISAKMDDTATNDSGTDSGTDAGTDSTDGAVTVPGPDIAALASKALGTVLDEVPTDMVCDSANVTIAVDNTEHCSFTGSDGKVHGVQVTISTFDADTLNYTIDAKVIS